MFSILVVMKSVIDDLGVIVMVTMEMAMVMAMFAGDDDVRMRGMRAYLLLSLHYIYTCVYINGLCLCAILHCSVLS
jgi:hypothetical protein